MATQYYRVTAYHPALNLSVIMDCNGMFEKLWQFSSFMVQKGFKILEVSTDEKFLDGNIEKAEREPDRVILHAQQPGNPENTTYGHDGITYHAVKVADMIYIPDRERKV
jgi:hypothetical protein